MLAYCLLEIVSQKSLRQESDICRSSVCRFTIFYMTNECQPDVSDYYRNPTEALGVLCNPPSLDSTTLTATF
jgi:hypothetical protein